MAQAEDQFLERIREQPVKPGELGAFLDGLGHADRVAAIRATTRTDQRRLYAGVEGASSLSLADLVPPGVADRATVRHYGKNTLPAFRNFEKRFCRESGQDPAAPQELVGFNFQTMSPLTGPGYFLARNDLERGEVAIDYTQVPAAAPPGWPAVRSNERGVSRLVYGFMIDTLRRVSEHVTIGSAARNGKDLGSWFILCREP